MNYFGGLCFHAFSGGLTNAWTTTQLPHYALHFCATGRILCGLDDHTPRVLTAPAAWWTMPHQKCVYGSETGASWTHFFVAFEGERAEIWRKNGFLPRSSPLVRVTSPSFKSTFARLLQILGISGSDAPRAVHEWERSLLELHTQNEAQRPNSPFETQVQTWLESVRAAPERSFNIAEVASEFAVAPATFRRAVKKQIGVAPYRFVVEQRLDHAALQLRTQRTPLQSVIKAAGFTDSSHFRRLFAARYGLAPLEYRQVTRTLAREIEKMQRRHVALRRAARTGTEFLQRAEPKKVANSLDELQFLDFGRGTPKQIPTTENSNAEKFLLVWHKNESLAWCGKATSALLADATHFVIFTGKSATIMADRALIPLQKSVTLSDVNTFEATFEALLDELNAPQLAGYEWARWWLEELLLQLHEQTQPSKEFARSSLENAVALWLESVRAAPPKEFSTANVARSMNVSEVHFRRVVKMQVGVAPHRFVLDRRLELAAQTLLESSAAVKTIAVRLGFADVAYFTRLFTRRFGVSPLRYRRHLHKEK